MSKISYLGDKYTHTYAAACKFLQSGDELVGYPTIGASIEAVTEGDCDYAVAPIENSCGGSIADTLDALWASPLYIRSETVIAVPQNLIGREDAEEKDVRVIYSHPQAIAQCHDFLRTYFLDRDVVAVASTAQALSMITDKSIAAIARTHAEGQKFLRTEIEDVRNNSTRFVLLGTEPVTTGNKCSVVFETRNRPGALVGALGLFEQFGLNMTKIESRPHKSKLGRYVFFVDFDAKDARTLSELLGALSQATLSLKFIGRYPVI